VLALDGERLRLVAPPARLAAVLTPELREEMASSKPALLLVASGRWRAALDDWPGWWRSRWSALVASNEARGLAHETAEQLAFLEAAELPDDAAEQLAHHEPSAEQLAHEPPDTWRAELENWPGWRREAWEERAAIGEHDGGLPPDEAERRAYLVAAALPAPLDDHDQERAEQLAHEPAELQPPADLAACLAALLAQGPGLVASLSAELQTEHAAPPPALALEECGHCHAVRLPRVTRCDLCGRRSWQTRQTEQPTAPPALALVPPPPPGTPTPPAELLTDDGARSLDPVGWWVVHPLACGGCGAKALADRGLGPCARCGWQKPPAERAALASRLAADPALCHRLASSP
jgi:ribosomal protein L37E